MDNIADLINKRARELTVDGHKTEIDIIKYELDRFYPGKLTPVKIDKKGRLLVETGSSALASEVRLKQYEILRSIDSALPGIVERLIISAK